MNGLVRLDKAHIRAAAEMLAGTFQDEPVYVYFVPDASARKRVLRHHFAMRLRYAVSYGEVYATSPELEGVAIWFPPIYRPMTFTSVLLNGGLPGLLRMGPGSVRRQVSVNDYLRRERRRNAPFSHWYLSSLAVEPVHRGKGYAGRLLRPMLARLDGQGLSSYLETQKRDNVRLYQHFGFAMVKESVIPGASIKTWAMLRRPAA